jgi:two-component system, OmpR family, sensor histidine kinase VicK
MIKLIENAENFFILEQVAEKSAQAFFIFDITQQHLHYVNPAFEQIWKRSRQSIYSNLQVIVDTIHPEDQAYVVEQYKRLLQNEENKNVEFRIILPDGLHKWVCFTTYLIHQDSKVRFITGYAEDISKNKEYSSNLLKYNAKKNAVLEILSHDLAAPFNTIQSIVSLIEKKMAQQDYPAVQDLLRYIKESSKKGSDMIRDFVTQEFLESSEVVLNKSRVDVVEKISLIMADYKRGEKLIPKQFELTTTSDSIFIEIDEMKFVQVMNNLISNAIKFTPDHGNITLHIGEKPASVLITITDNGIGIPKELQPILFDKFTKARRPGLRGEKTVGLGMSVVKTIVELHQGTIWLESDEGKGSKFFIEIPKIDQTQ